MQKIDELTQETSETTTRRSVFGLLAGALLVAGFAGAQSADARRRGGNNNGRGGRGGNGRGGRGGRGNGRHNGRNGRRNNH